MTKLRSLVLCFPYFTANLNMKPNIQSWDAFLEILRLSISIIFTKKLQQLRYKSLGLVPPSLHMTIFFKHFVTLNDAINAHSSRKRLYNINYVYSLNAITCLKFKVKLMPFFNRVTLICLENLTLFKTWQCSMFRFLLNFEKRLVALLGSKDSSNKTHKSAI
jgi:hypothetical protein